MDDFFYRTFIDSMDSLNAEQAQEIANRLSDMGYVSNRMNTSGAPGVDATAFGEANRTMLVMSPAMSAPAPMSKMSKAFQFKEGERVVIGGNISPAYLRGATGVVTKRNGSTISGRTKWRVNVKLDNKVGRFDNSYPIGIPVDCLTKL